MMSDSSSPEAVSRRLSIAPMLDWTDTQARYFLRLISRHVRLYTEMVTTGALCHGDPARHLDYFPEEHPLVLQLGGSDPHELAHGARLGEQWGYDEINLNVGCPSDRVMSGRFGACLMAEPEWVGACVRAMREAVSVPVSVKCRIGIDRQDTYEPLRDFVGTVSEAGCGLFVVHARKAWLDGLSPKENRDIPPLRYPYVYRLKEEFPHLHISLNGGVRSLEETRVHLERVDGVMIGREAYHNPWVLAQADREIFGEAEAPLPERLDVLERFIRHAERQLAAGVPLHAMTRHILGLFHEQPGARRFRRILSEQGARRGAGLGVLIEAGRAVGLS